jgi:hypothetical protein
LKQLLALSAIVIAIVAVVAFAPAMAVSAGNPAEKVPIIGVLSVDLGNSPFSSMETFQIHPGQETVHRTSNFLNISFANNAVSPINDSLSFNDSIHLSKNPLVVDFPVQNGTYKLSTPPQQSYLNSIFVKGSSSFTYVTIVESLPTQDIYANGIQINGKQMLNNSDFYNLTIAYGNSSFDVHSPGLIYVGNVLTQVSLSINTAAAGASSILRFTFPLKDGPFTFSYNQVLSAGYPINSVVPNQLQVPPGFVSPLIQNLLSNSISLAIGGAIFIGLILGMFVYYRRK